MEAGSHSESAPSLCRVAPVPLSCELLAMAPKKKEEPKPAPAPAKPPEPEVPKIPEFDPASVTVKQKKERRKYIKNLK